MADGRSLPPSHFDGAQLAQMREWVEDGTPESQFSQAKSWRDEQKYMADLAQRVKDRMSQAGVSIEGQGGEAMQNAVAPVALWSEVAADNAEAQAQRMQSQGEAFKKVQTSIPKKNEEQHPPEDWWLEDFGSAIGVANTDTENANAHNEQLRQEAVTAFQGYQNTSQGNVESSAIFTPPPEAGKNGVVAAAPPPPPAGSIDTGGMSSGSAGTESASAGGGGVGGGSAGGSAGMPGGSAGGGGVHTPSPSTPSGTSPAGSAPAPPQPWQQGTLEPPRAGGAQGGMGGAGGFVPGGSAGGGSSAGGSGRGSGTGSGAGSGARGGSAGGRGALGPGGSSGSGGSQPGGQGASSASSTSSNGRGGAGGMGGAAGRGAGAKGQEDEEHYSPEFLKGDYGAFDDELPPVAPPVFGEDR